MSLKKIFSLTHTLAFRLAVYYTVIFSVTSFIAFLIFYLIISSTIENNRDQDLVGDLREFSSVLKIKGYDELKNTITIEAEGDGVANSFFRLFTPEGQEIFSTDMTHWRDIEISHSALKHLRNGSSHIFETLEIKGRKHKARSVYGVIGSGIIMQLGKTLENDEEFLELFRTVFGIIMVLLIPFATGTGWLMGRQALLGVDEVTQTALNISKGDLEQRVSFKTRAEEITRLANTFNSMLDRINALVSGSRNMMDDIAHDLKKPIARIHLIAEKSLSTGNTDDYYAANIIEECDSLMQMINTMLDTSEAEAGTAKLHLQEIDIAAVVRKAYELFYPLAEDKNLNFTLDILETYPIIGDIHKIQRMVANLLDNALKYTPPSGHVAISMKEDKDQIQLSIKDTGLGISDDDLPHIFERFHRGDKSRSEAGVGLGLTLAKAIAVSHGGDITVNSSFGKGSTFTIILPIQR